ncbi:pyridoxal-5'-phosphate-dependent protein [Actinosynnema sp. ALI-1.44]|uniref:pyridoxal-phosphate dependent enzyme n=1 Tax=Actinosynnema sp. ALI-1.44 TaxID=1933779 RepID=UPI00097CAF81|nr:pyridoxal-phosphate dependent enzyme [Actinosynnema sp. ALI-1.44]ONI79827.1 pyridoxal-5'-phosphate-dependent protein [Actinosynnema sp. ALI-1.44]
MNADIDVRSAAARLVGVAHHTPVLRSSTLNDLVGAEVFLKCENFQRGGAFKFRGAFNAASRLPPESVKKGLLTHSSGNHGQAVALAARELGVPAVVLMPHDAPRSKVAATVGYGAEVIRFDRYGDDRELLAATVAADRDMTLIPPYDHPDVIAGQGTTALELFEEVGELDLLVVPVGGGGLIAGCALAAADRQVGTRIVGVEPAAGDDTKRSLEAGHRIAIEVPRTIADGQAAATPGELTFSINRRLVDGVVVVTEDQIREAMRFAFERLKLVLEPSGASALAALISSAVHPLPARVGLVISGGNVDVSRFTELCG